MLFRIAKRLPPHILRVRTLCEGQPIIPEQFKDRSLQTKRKASPFDALGYQLGDEPSVEGPHATQRGVIDGLGETSFTISGVRVTGPVLVMPYFSTLWNVEQMQDITPQSFALIKLMVPRPDIVLIGTGAQILVSNDFLFSSMQSNRRGLRY